MSSLRERSLGELFSELADETRTLIRQEVQLAKTELSEKAKVIGKDVTSMAVGAAILYAGLLTLIAALVVGLSYLMPLGWAVLLVGLAVTGIGAFMVTSGSRDLREEGLAPEKTTRTIKETRQWAKDQIR
jgi:VIT1/CCC1 family predicted Fe2+/Mn2+ transporter